MAFEFGLPSPPGLSDRTRMTLCMFLLAFLAFNPVRQVTDWGRDSLAASSASMAAPVAGRTMLSTEPGESRDRGESQGQRGGGGDVLVLDR